RPRDPGPQGRRRSASVCTPSRGGRAPTWPTWRRRPDCGFPPSPRPPSNSCDSGSRRTCGSPTRSTTADTRRATGGGARSSPSAAARRARPHLQPGRALSEHASKAVLAAYGIAVTREVLATSASQAVRAAAELGPPVVMKISSPDLAHKADLGLVEVGVAGAGEVRATYTRLLEQAKAAAPAAVVD